MGRINNIVNFLKENPDIDLKKFVSKICIETKCSMRLAKEYLRVAQDKLEFEEENE